SFSLCQTPMCAPFPYTTLFRSPPELHERTPESFQNSDNLLRPVRRPEARAGDVRQQEVVSVWHLRNYVNRLSTVRSAEESRTRVIEGAAFLDVIGPIGCPNHVVGFFVGFDCVLVDS